MTDRQLLSVAYPTREYNEPAVVEVELFATIWPKRIEVKYTLKIYGVK